MTCAKIGNMHICYGGPILVIDTAKGPVAFENHSYFGPMPVSRKKGDYGSERVLPENHPFWAKVTRWLDSERLVVNGWAVME